MYYRLFLKVSDLAYLSGTTKRNCRNTMQTIKGALGKQKHQHVTIKEYCDYEGINYDEVAKALKISREI